MRFYRVTNFEKHLKRDNRYQGFSVASFIANRLKQRHFSLKEKKRNTEGVCQVTNNNKDCLP